MTFTIFLASGLLEVLLPTHRRQQLMGGRIVNDDVESKGRARGGWFCQRFDIQRGILVNTGGTPFKGNSFRMDYHTFSDIQSVWNSICNRPINYVGRFDLFLQY